MKLAECKLIFYAVGLIGTLLIATPILGAFLHLPSGEPFSELYLLGPEYLADNYPQNVTVGQNYSFYVGVTNHLDSSAYYVLYVKFRNETDILPGVLAGTPSPLPALYEYRFVIQNGEKWETLLNFSFSNASISATQSTVRTLTINDVTLHVDKPAVRNSTTNVSHYQLFFELWLYDAQSNSIQFNNRFAGLSMNFTQSTIPNMVQ
jgi:hypothetical protein